MKTKLLSLPFFFILITLLSCEKDEKNPTLKDFCSIKPNGWDCEILDDNFNINDFPRNADNPIAIIKYKNVHREFTRFTDTKVNPSLILDFYSIKQKQELIDFIRSQEMYSWCIPIYYGETKDYFIMTSPCFINSGSFTDEADSCISDLHKALESLITTNDYNLIGN
jgi:hypothetical protein